MGLARAWSCLWQTFDALENILHPNYVWIVGHAGLATTHLCRYTHRIVVFCYVSITVRLAPMQKVVDHFWENGRTS